MSSNPPGGSFIVGEYPSPSRLNRKTFTHLRGSDVASLTTIPNMAIVITEDGGAYTKDQFLIRNSDNTAWLSSSAGKHTHSADDDLRGGLLSEVNYYNATIAYDIMLPSPSYGDFAKLGNATASDDVAGGRVKITTGTSSGTYAHLGKHGVPISFTRRSRFLLRGYVTDGNSLTARAGVGAEDVNTGPTIGAPRYGMEVCDVTTTDRDWQCFSGSGTARSAEDAVGSNVAVQQTVPRFYRFDYTPGQNIAMYINNTLVKSKQTNVPTGGGSYTLTNGINNISWGIKTANTTSKDFYLYGIAFTGTGSDAAWQA